MSKNDVIEIADTDSDSSTGSNGHNLVQTNAASSARARFIGEGSSVRRAFPLTQTPSQEPAQATKKQNAPPVAPLVEPRPKRSKKTDAPVVTPPLAARPSEAETVVPIRRRPASLWINSSDSSLSPELSATLSATLSGERRMNQPAGVTYYRPYGGGSKPVPLAGISSSNPTGRGIAAPISAGVASAQPHPLQLGAAVRPLRNHPVRLNVERRTVDFLSQLETENPAPAPEPALAPEPAPAPAPAPVQIQRENPTNVETRAAWGNTLTLGNGRVRRLNLNLRLGFRG